MEWRDRLHDHEETPPPGAWHAIREEVAGHPIALARTLGGMEQQPPPKAWEKVKAALSVEAESREPDNRASKPAAGPVRSLPSRAYAYAASVAGIGLFLALAYWFQTGQANGSGILNGIPMATKRNASEPKPENQVQQAEATTGDSTSTLSYAGARPSKVPGQIELYDARGNRIGVSAKLREMTDCMVPGVDASASKAMNRRKWNRTLRKWQKRMQESDYIPSPGNLFDFAGLAAVLNEKP